MNNQKREIIEKAAGIIRDAGLKGLTIQHLDIELRDKNATVKLKLRNQDDILLLLLHDFETDINDLIYELDKTSEPPDNKLKILFKKLYFLFLQKPFYLDILFDKNLRERDKSVKDEIEKIRTIAHNYLSSVIDKGKTEHTFNTSIPTKVIVGKLLSDFRIFMKDEQLIHETILEIKSIKTLNELKL